MTPFQYIREDWKALLQIAALGSLAIFLNHTVGCAAADRTAEDARKDAACAATRSLFDKAQDRVLKASCMEYPSADTCPAHEALALSYVEALARLQCETVPE